MAQFHKENKISIGFRMGEAFKLIGKNFSMALPAHGIEMTIEQFLLLNAINDKDDVNQQELSKILQKDKSGILRLTDELEKRKLVVRVVDEQDRRKKPLVLTKKGVETIKKVLEIEAAVIEQFLEGVTAQELAVFASVLDKMLERMQQNTRK